MKRSIFRLVYLLGLVSVVLIGCASPPSTATPTPAPAPTAAPQPIAPAAATPAAADAVWQKVIADAKKEGTVTLYSFGFIGDLGNATRAAFKERYGINLEFITGTGSQLLPRIQSEYRSGQNVADVLEGSDINAIFAKKEGLTQAYGDLPEMRSKDAWIVDPHFDKEGQIIAYTFTNYPLWINTKLLSPADAPRSWKAVADPKWKGKIVVTDPDTMPIPGRLWVVLTGRLGFSQDYFRQLGELDLAIAPNQRENDAMLARGQYAMTLTSTEVTMGPLISEGAPLAPIDMVEGVPSLPNPTVTLMGKAPHPNATRLFFNWLVSKEGQDVHGKFRSVGSIRKDVADYSPQPMRVKYTKLIPLGQEDEEAAAKVQADKVISKLWKKK
ncbi:MAG: extracellular solute-binding protein [Chloroflexi bacterium]|nr:extracellular solute-binding protein [Chloroflexota bacterium]